MGFLSTDLATRGPQKVRNRLSRGRAGATEPAWPVWWLQTQPTGGFPRAKNIRTRSGTRGVRNVANYVFFALSKKEIRLIRGREREWTARAAPWWAETGPQGA